MERDTISPYASFLEYSEEMYLMLGNIKVLIFYGFSFVVITLLFMIDGYFKLNFFLNYMWHLGIIAGFFAIIIIYASIPVYKDIGKWEKNFINSSFFLTFSVLPIEGKYREDLLLVKILDVFPRIRNMLSDYPDDIILDNFTNVTIKGKTKDLNFDVFIGSYRSDDADTETRKMMEIIKGNAYLVAKIFDKEEAVTSTDLDEYRSDILDAISQLGVKKRLLDKLSPRVVDEIRVSRIIIISNSSFSEDAIEYVKDSKNWIKKVSFDLIEQQNNMSNIVWLS